MPAEKTTAIVLKVVDFSETSCVVTMYTRDFGKVTALAKGARRLKSPFEGAIDLLAYCRIVFLRKSVDKLDLLTEARLERRFRSASIDLGRLYAGLYIIELMTALTDHADPFPKLFDLLENTIAELDNAELAGQLPDQLMRFELQLLTALGHQPSLDHCVGCGQQIDLSENSTQRVAFGMIAGGVFCGKCRVGKRGIVGVQTKTLRFMHELHDGQLSIQKVDGLPANRGELRGLLDQYVADLLGYRPKLAAWLKPIYRDH